MKKAAIFVIVLFGSGAGLGVGSAQETAPNSAVVTVDARLNSATGGTGATTGLVLQAGDRLIVEADQGKTWSAGKDEPCSRVSNADGISECYGTFTHEGLTAPHGALVGRIGEEGWFRIGSSFDGEVDASGPLSLYYWDSHPEDNEGSIPVRIEVQRMTATGTLLLRAIRVKGHREAYQAMVRPKGSSEIVHDTEADSWSFHREIVCPGHNRPIPLEGYGQDIDLPPGEYEVETRMGHFRRDSRIWSDKPYTVRRTVDIGPGETEFVCFRTAMITDG